MPTDQRIVDNLIKTCLRKKFTSEYFQLFKRNDAFLTLKKNSAKRLNK